MSAQPIQPSRSWAEPVTSPPYLLTPMHVDDVAEVAAIEKAIYAAPWSDGNFADSLAAGYCAWTLRFETGAAATRSAFEAAPASPAPPSSPSSRPIVGYFVLMAAVDEAHLLNVSIAPDWQARGNGLFLLRKATALAVAHNATSVILEVRPSNTRALAVYRRFGFREHGLRRRYYPVSPQTGQVREDAIVMRLQL